MNWNYEAWLATKLNSLCLELGLSVKPKVFSEREFLRSSELAPDEVGVVTRRSQSEITFGAETLPLQILVMSEANSSEEATRLFTTFAERCNYATDPESGDVTVKHQYSAPVTLTNFDSVSYGYRSVLYVNATLVIVGSAIDVTDLEIDGTSYEAINFDVSYQMQTNTQTKATAQIATSVKTASTVAITFTMTLRNDTFIGNVLGIINGTVDGNTTFSVSYMVGAVEMTANFKLVSAHVSTGRDSVPTIQIGMTR